MQTRPRERSLPPVGRKRRGAGYLRRSRGRLCWDGIEPAYARRVRAVRGLLRSTGPDRPGLRRRQFLHHEPGLVALGQQSCFRRRNRAPEHLQAVLCRCPVPGISSGREVVSTTDMQERPSGVHPFLLAVRFEEATERSILERDNPSAILSRERLHLTRGSSARFRGRCQTLAQPNARNLVSLKACRTTG
jgi:hypothetical protein